MEFPLSTPAGDDIYEGRDPRDIPFYAIREASLCLDLNPATLRTWALGRNYPVRTGQRTADALLELPDVGNPMLSFVNLMEAQFLRALRREHDFSMQHIRRALEALPGYHSQPHPLAFVDFLTDGVDLFVRNFGELIDLNRPEQILIEKLLESHLRRIDRDATGPIRFFPVVISDAERPIAVDPRVAFGHPVVAGTRVRTEIISGRVVAGDSVEAVSEDLGLTKEQVEQAVAFEQRAKRKAA
jgi:uncharacterized protein (DUF433 family)/DNA-binding transcriptional MerR regulator